MLVFSEVCYDTQKIALGSLNFCNVHQKWESKDMESNKRPNSP